MEDEYSLMYGKHSQSLARRYSYNLRLKLIKESLTGNNCNVILDIGSATGDYAMDLKNSSFEVICVDVNLRHLKIAKRKDTDLFVGAADASFLPFKDGSFDAITILNALRYFSDPLLSLKECNRVLKSDGNLVLICHNKFCPDTLVTKRGGARYLSLKKLKELLEKSNFKVPNEELLFIPPPFIPKILLNITLNLGAKLSRTHLKNIFPEIFIHAVQEGVDDEE